MPTTVLVVDDEEILRLLVVEALTLLDLEAVECANADEALRVLETTSDIRLVITDICMPGSMDGAGLGRVIWERWPELPVILSSGNRVVLNHRLPSNSSFIRKPWSLDDFHQMVNRHLGK